MADKTEMHRIYWYWLCNIPGIGRKKIERLLEEFGTPEEICRQKRVEWFTEKEQASFEESKKIKWLLKYRQTKENGIKIITCEDEDYPKRLVCLHDRPYVMYVKGRLPDEERPTCAIVGARNCTRYGATLARELGGLLAKNNIQVISGLARGIDGEGQFGAVREGGASFGILGCGVDICYPEENFKLYEQIQDRGGLISEFAPGTTARPTHFPMRNRLISALSDKLIVVEAKKKSGSLITVDFALEQGKEVFGVPGRVTDALSEGVNNLLRMGAGVLSRPEDILEEFDVSNGMDGAKDKKNNFMLAEKENMLYSMLDLQPKNIQYIIEETGMDVTAVSEILLELQLKGLVLECGKNHYAKIKI
ncbi:MAG: DNA-protecting protein DprA [Lachnospiraceae bacterium]|nr:DNA-protecting protein DprA [Lachnospiraceae bacterium]